VRSSGWSSPAPSLACTFRDFRVGLLGPLRARRPHLADLSGDGNLGPGGLLPCNTNGGLIGEGYIHGLNLVTEAVRQIRGTAANQLPAVDVALVSASRTGAILTRT
jgi:hypothetical protein